MNFKIILIIFILSALPLRSQPLDLTHPIDRVVGEGVYSYQLPQVTHKLWQPYEINQLLSTLYITGQYQALSAYTVVSRNERLLVIKGVSNPIIDQIQFQNATLYSPQHLNDHIKTAIGIPLKYDILAQDQYRLESLYHENGYDFARVDAMTITRNILTFTLSEGTISTLNISGLSTIQPFVVYREFRLGAGSVFNSKTLREDRERLLRLGYFSDISYPKLTQKDTDKNEYAVQFDFKEQKINLIDIGLEQEDTLAVMFVRSNWNHVLLNSDTLSGKVQYGAESDQIYKITSYTLNYRQPWFLNMTPFSLDIDLWEEFRQEFAGGNPLTQILVKNKRRGARIGTSVPIIRDRLAFSIHAKTELVSPLESLGNTHDYSLHSVSSQLFYKDYTSLNNPKSGISWALEYEKGGNLGFYNFQGLNFSRYAINLAHFTPLSTTDTFGIHAFLGIFYSTDFQFNTFESESYTLGGANSLRGYKETDGLIGTSKALVNMEYRHDFTADLQGVLFYDLGRVFDSGPIWSSDFLHAGRGFGVRYFTPISPLRLDFSWDDQGSLIIHFGLGQVF